MDQETLREVRNATGQRRRPPGDPIHVRATVDGSGVIGEDIGPGPIELTVEVTDAGGELAGWLDDAWWTTLIERWGDDPVTVHVAPTPTALLHPVALCQLEMLHRVAPRWRLVGHAHPEEVAGDNEVELLAASPYDEVRFLDGSGLGASRADGASPALSIDEIFGRVRREQARLGVSRPILVRLPSAGSAVEPGW